MSGGSYNYLYASADDPEALVEHVSDIKAMAERLAGLPYARDAATETERILALIERLHMQVKVRSEALEDVWHAVEWWDSGDYSEDAVRKALAKYRGEPAAEAGGREGGSDAAT